MTEHFKIAVTKGKVMLKNTSNSMRIIRVIKGAPHIIIFIC